MKPKKKNTLLANVKIVLAIFLLNNLKLDTFLTTTKRNKKKPQPEQQ